MKKTKDRIILFLLALVIGLIIAVSMIHSEIPLLGIFLFNFVFGIAFMMGITITAKWPERLIVFSGTLFGAVLVIAFKILF